MDRYIFTHSVEQIKKLVKLGDYVGAMKIADEVDWRRVNSVSLLSLVSEIYEKNRDYTEAKEILLLAYERAPIGKRLLYKLTMLALAEGNIPEAEAYYREFYDLAPDDSRQHILRYLILKDKGAPPEQLINTLEQYTHEELDERWMYELAELYHQAGQSEACVAMCDKIMLMFGIGNYVDKAIDLKLNREGKALTAYQQSLIDNRDRYESKLRDMDEHPDTYDPDADAIVVEKPENYSNEVNEETNARIIPEPQGAGDVPGEVSGMQGSGDASKEKVAARAASWPQGSEDVPSEPQEEDEVVRADISQILSGAGATAALYGEPGMDSAPELEVAQVENEKINSKVNAALESAYGQETNVASEGTYGQETSATKEVAATQEVAAAQETAETQEVKEESEMTIYTVNFIVERRSEEDGFSAAVRLLKLMHEHTGSKNKVMKIKAEKLNETGVTASRDRLIGRDLIVEQAGDLSYTSVEEIIDLIKAEPENRVVVLIDNPMQIRKMTSAYPELLKLFHVDKENDSVLSQQDAPEEKAESKAEARPEVKPEVRAEARAAAATASTATAAAARADAFRESGPEPAAEVREPAVREPEMYREPAMSREAAMSRDAEGGYADDMTYAGGEGAIDNRMADSRMSEQMESREFADYAQRYAESIDCSIDGKSKLALFERIELMEEDGIPLTRENAVALIEEAADLAEKPPIGRKLAGIFQSKYDKNDKLILREEHFIH